MHCSWTWDRHAGAGQWSHLSCPRSHLTRVKRDLHGQRYRRCHRHDEIVNPSNSLTWANPDLCRAHSCVTMVCVVSSPVILSRQLLSRLRPILRHQNESLAGSCQQRRQHHPNSSRWLPFSVAPLAACPPAVPVEDLTL